jgi:hypothetical protein
MTKKQLDRYCDEVLRILYKSRNEGPTYFGVGEYRNEEKIADDLFVKINVSEEDTKTVIQALEEVYHYVETDAKEKTHYYDLDSKQNIHSAVYAVKITDAGKYFIQTTSFSKESTWKNINRWFPNIPNIVGITAVLISMIACTICYKEARKKNKELLAQKQELLQMQEAQNRLQQQMDSILKKYPPTDTAAK